MQGKRQLLVLILALTASWMISQNADLWTQKITIENSLRDKLTFAISRVLDETQFFVNIEVELVTQSGSGASIMSGSSEDGGAPRYLAESESITPGLPTEADRQPEKPEKKAPIYSPIPGLPAIPVTEVTDEPVIEEAERGIQGQSEERNVAPQYSYQEQSASAIKGIDVTVYLEESIATAGIKRDIVEIICGIIPDSKNCEDCNDCVNFKQMEFREETTVDSNVSKLEERLSSLEKANDEQRSQIVKMEKNKLNNMLLNLQTKLENIETERNLLVRLDRIDDSTRLATLVRKEERYQIRRDSLLLVLEQKREEALNQRISAESKYAEKLFSLAEKQLEKAYQSPGPKTQPPTGNPYNSSGLGLQYPEASKASNDWIWVLITLIIVGGLVVSVLLLKKQKKPVYLKQKSPKNNTPPPSNGGNLSEASDISPPPPTPPQVAPPQSKTSTTHVDDDKDVIKSEIKSLRQSAVTMSVGQKEAATKIIQDWLDEPAQGDSQKEEE